MLEIITDIVYEYQKIIIHTHMVGIKILFLKTWDRQLEAFFGTYKVKAPSTGFRR